MRDAVSRQMWGFLIHLGTKMWPAYAGDARLEVDRSVWDAVTERMAEKKLNTLVIDLGEGLRYPSHPELGTVGSWEPEQMREEIARLRKMGILAVPKLNFSSSHDLWLGEWRRYLSTPDYYRVCADVIRDVAAVFDESPLFHLGWDEETIAIQGRANKFPLVRLRQGDLWWHDCLFTVGEVERAGMRPWVWSDFCWHHPETFLKRMPKSVLQSNWYYGRNLAPEHLKACDAQSPSLGGPRVVQVDTYRVLDEAGFDQVPCGSTYREDSFQTQNFPATVKHCRKVVAPERLKGFLMAPWLVKIVGVNRQGLLDSVDNVAEARDGHAES